MNFYDIYTEIESECQNTSIRSKIKTWINQEITDIIHNCFERYLIKFADFLLVANQEDYYLPADCGELIGFYNNSLDIQNMEPADYVQFIKDGESRSDYNYMVMDYAQPDIITPNAGSISVGSTSAVDTFQLRMTGIDRSFNRVEWYFDLTGTTQLNVGAASITTQGSLGVYQIHSMKCMKPNIGSISVYLTGTTGLQCTLSAGSIYEDFARYRQKVRFNDIPTAASSIKIYYYKKPRDMQFDYEFPAIPEYAHRIIIAGVLNRHYKFFNKIDMAQYWAIERDKGLKLLKNREFKIHSNRNLLMNPEI